MKQSVRVLANYVFAIASEHAGSGLVDETNCSGDVDPIDTFRCGVQNESQLFADFGVFFFGKLTGHKLAHLVGDAHEEPDQLFVGRFPIVAEECNDPQAFLK
ncbi:MAG: hypothetical protein WAN72_00455 [Candidatus Acidiferrales bacterium]